jgi:hypothetical protein
MGSVLCLVSLALALRPLATAGASGGAVGPELQTVAAVP